MKQLTTIWIVGVFLISPLQAADESSVEVPTLEVTGSLAIPAISVPRAALSPDGQRLVVPLKDDRLGVWNMSSGKQEMVTRQEHDWQIFWLAFTPDGTKIATGSSDKTAKLWDANTGDLISTLKGHEDRIEYLNVSPRGKYVFTSTGKTWPYEKYGPVEARIWNANTGELAADLQGHNGTITRAEFSDDETRILTASDDHTVRVWDVASAKELHKFDLGSKVMSAIYSQDDKTILTSSRGHRNSYAITADRQHAEQASASQAVVKLWDATTGKELLNLPHPAVEHDPHYGTSADVRASFNKGGDHILTELNGLIIYWDKATGKKLATLREMTVPSPTVVFSPNSEFFVVLNRQQQPAELWNVTEKKKVRELEVPYLSDFWSMEAYRFFSPDGKTFYSLQKGEFRWWSLGDLVK